MEDLHVLVTYEYDCIFDTGKNTTTELIQNLKSTHFFGLQQQLNNFILVGKELKVGLV